MDFLVGLVLYPIFFVKGLLETLIGFLLVLVPLLIRSVTRGLPRSYVDLFAVFSSVPFGRKAFSSLIGVVAPYTASIGATIQDCSDSSVSASMADRPWLRNPFSSVHAIALANLGELTTGLAVMSALQRLKSVRGIPVEVNTSYLKKARGTITCVCALGPVLEALADVKGPCRKPVEGILSNAKGERVAVCSVVWAFSLKKKSGSGSGERKRAADGS